jgi:hypothetical protein
MTSPDVAEEVDSSELDSSVDSCDESVDVDSPYNGKELAALVKVFACTIIRVGRLTQRTL